LGRARFASERSARNYDTPRPPPPHPPPGKPLCFWGVRSPPPPPPKENRCPDSAPPPLPRKQNALALDPNFPPKGALMRLSFGTPESGGHPDPAAGQAPVFCRAAEEFDGRCVYLFPWLIHVDPRHCSCAVDAWATLIRGTPPSGLDPSLNSVRPRARPWRTRSPLRGCYWSALPGARHAALLTPKAHGRGEVRHRG
jgi:hypothetical protein